MDGTGKQNRRNRPTRTRGIRRSALLLAVVLTAMMALTQMPAAPVSGSVSVITLNYSAYTLQVGKKLKLKASVADDQLKSETIVWKSSKKAVVSVNENGNIRAKKEGSARITATIQGTDASASCTVQVVKKSGLKKNAEEVSALKAIIKAQPDASISGDLDDLNQYTWTETGKERRLTRIVWPDAGLSGEISFAGLPALEYLDCSGGHLTSLDIRENPALKHLDCSEQELAALDVSSQKELEVLKCGNNRLTQLQVQNNRRLTVLDCSQNRLTALDTKKNPALTSLDCEENQLTALDTKKNPALKELICGANQLTSLNVSSNPA